MPAPSTNPRVTSPLDVTRCWLTQLPTIRFWVMIAVALVALRAPSLFVEVLDPDEAGHAVGSQVWLDGGTLYHDYVDNKQPLLYLTYAAVFKCFGSNLIAVHAMTIPWLWLTALVLYQITKAVWSSEGAGRVAAVVFVLTSSASLEKDMLATNTEVLMNLPLVAAFYWALVRREQGTALRALGGGIALGLAVLYNLKALVAFPVLVGATLTLNAALPRRLQSAAGICLGALVPPVIVVSWFALQGNAGELWYWNVQLNQKYAAAGVPLWMIETRRGILYGLPRLVIFMATTIAAWIGAILATRNVFRHDKPWAHPALPYLAWLVVSFYPVCAGGRFYGHYFIQFLPPLAILGSGWLSQDLLTERHSAPRRWLWFIVLLVPILGYTVVGYVRLAKRKLEGQHPRVAAVTSYIRNHTRSDDRLFIWGYWSQVYYYAHRPPASRFVYPQTLSGYIPGSPRSLDPNDDTSAYMVPDHWDQLREDLQRHPAELIVDTAPAAIHYWEKYPITKYPWLANLIRAEYHLETTIDNVVIYRRNP